MAMNVCQRCGTEFEKRPGRGRQPLFCEDCRPIAEQEQRQRRFLNRYHIIDTLHGVCVNCSREVQH